MVRQASPKKSPDDEKAKARAAALHAKRLSKRTPKALAEGLGIFAKEAERVASADKRADDFGRKLNASAKRMRKAVRLMVLTPSETVATLHQIGLCKRSGDPVLTSMTRWW